MREALVEDARLHDPAGIAATLEITNTQVSVRDLVQHNRRPACLICGTRERRFQDHKSFAVAQMPLLERVELDAGHGVNMEPVVGFNAAVQGFVGRCLTS